MEDIFRYISEELCNSSAAAALIDDIDESLDRVCLDPLMCPPVRSSLIKDKTLRKLIVKITLFSIARSNRKGKFRLSVSFMG